jgi:S1-C subfamily serine protease
MIFMEQSPLQRLAFAASLSGILFVAACAGPIKNTAEAEVAPIEQAINAIVGIYADIPGDAHSARSLGTRRQGSGVLIDDDGLILTVGYLILEAERAGIVSINGESLPADIVAYDHDSGFGLLRAKGPINAKPIGFGSSAQLLPGSPVLAVSFEGPEPVIPARVISRRPFVGYWEYLLEKAIFTAPPLSEYGGAALIDNDGRLLGIGSLMVNDALDDTTPMFGNVFVPIDLLKPILDDLIAKGRPSVPAAPWLGLFSDEAEGRVIVTRLSTGGPAEKSGVEEGDIIIGVGGHRVRNQVDMYRKIRKQGRAGDSVALDVLAHDSYDLKIRRILIESLDRRDWIKVPDPL